MSFVKKHPVDSAAGEGKNLKEYVHIIEVSLILNYPTVCKEWVIVK